MLVNGGVSSGYNIPGRPEKFDMLEVLEPSLINKPVYSYNCSGVELK
jgi:hypothetical protein